MDERIRKRLWLHPTLVTMAAWIVCIWLYQMRLSNRLWLDLGDVAGVSAIVILGMTLGLMASCLPPVKIRRFYDIEDPDRRTERSAWFAFAILTILFLLEVLYSGFIPILAKLRGQQISHFAFGIPSVHGFVLAGYLFFTSCGVLAFLKYRGWRYLLPAISSVVIAVLIVNRKLLMVAVIQSLVLVILMNQRPLRATIITASVIVFTVLTFGVVGDIRSGSVIDDSGGFTRDTIVQKIPGLDWAYLYLTTPIHNLTYASIHADPENGAFPRRTFGPLIPSVLDGTDEDASDRYRTAAKTRHWLDSPMFNVSTAFINPLLDYGMYGVFFYAILTSYVASSVFFLSEDWVGIIVSVTLYATSVLTVFSDSFVNLNVIGQLLWVFVVYGLSRFRIGSPSYSLIYESDEEEDLFDEETDEYD
ncbi:oligosaccharide repeat unit polymerase [Stieleria sp. TO1_6]|uniref:O-antigen polymerase n=1 Tax=Stieleria tagensis TaxID=2956795 RepID=UPI00209AB9FB|nr:O-antigen polymerase [Stieleria tagensis]MCO8121619.1 oligosaccharide repeat unit polymerase [Stieleria tagensis]